MSPNHRRLGFATILTLGLVGLVILPSPALADTQAPRALTVDPVALELAIRDLMESYGEAYPRGRLYLARLRDLETIDPLQSERQAQLAQLQREALLDTPLLDFERLLVLKRKRGQIGLPTNHQCNSTLKQLDYDNELAILSPVQPGATLTTLYRPPQRRFVGEMDLHYDADRLLFTMPNGTHWNIFEIHVDGTGLRQVNRGEHPDVDCFDGCYLPNGRIVFSSTASYTSVPCWHGKERACSLCLMDADGSQMRQLCFDQDLDLHPAVLSSGQVIYSRWDYTGVMHMYMRPLMVMNPDGTGQRAVYGSNSYWPNCLFFPREIPGHPGKLICILAGYHNDPRMGQLVLLNLGQGWYENEGVVQMIPGRGKRPEPVIRDQLTAKIWPKFLHPFPLSEKVFLVAMQPQPKAAWGIYLADVFDNLVPILVDKDHDFFEPIPILRRDRPLTIPDQVDLNRDDATVYIHDIYQGPGLAGVPRGTIKALRIAAYHYGLPGMAGPDKCGSGGPWEVMRILGSVPINDDGSATFQVPACTPLTLQPLDQEGKAVQLMRSWFTAMPGEVVSCVGCHESPRDVPSHRMTQAASQQPQSIKPWYGPARGFDFAREVQPVLNTYCVTCHDGTDRTLPDLRAEEHFPHYQGRKLNRLGHQRLHPAVKAELGGSKIRYTPAYEALLPYIRRVNVEDDVRILVPGEYHADTSELVQLLKKGHYRVALDEEAWDRLVTWIDLNGPCHGTWNEVARVPNRGGQRRWELAQMYGGPKDNPEIVPPLRPVTLEPAPAFQAEPSPGQPLEFSAWTFPADIARQRQTEGDAFTKTIQLSPNVTMRLVRIPAGTFVMGDDHGPSDESPREAIRFAQDFWMSACEITNEQFHRFDPEHRSGVYTKRFVSQDGPGLSLESPQMPVVRVSWERAQAFCRWLSKKTGVPFQLPTEAEWEYACRAGTDTSLNYGDITTDFSQHANLADAALRVFPVATGGLDSNINLTKGNGVFESAIYGSVVPCDARFDDGQIVTAPVGRFRPNAWGLYDMHGNVSEWTRTSYRAYPYHPRDGRNQVDAQGEKVVRGGSWCDRPVRCRSAFRLSYPCWQRVFNVGFRVVSAPPNTSEFVAKRTRSSTAKHMNPID